MHSFQAPLQLLAWMCRQKHACPCIDRATPLLLRLVDSPRAVLLKSLGEKSLSLSMHAPDDSSNWGADNLAVQQYYLHGFLQYWCKRHVTATHPESKQIL